MRTHADGDHSVSHKRHELRRYDPIVDRLTVTRHLDKFEERRVEKMAWRLQQRRPNTNQPVITSTTNEKLTTSKIAETLWAQ
jgi:hypothetical protein